MHSELNWPEGGGVMCGSNKSGSMAQEPGTAGFYVVTADPKAVHDRAVAAGAEITRELQLASLRRTRVRAEGPRGQRLVLRQLPRRTTHLVVAASLGWWATMEWWAAGQLLDHRLEGRRDAVFVVRRPRSSPSSCSPDAAVSRATRTRRRSRGQRSRAPEESAAPSETPSESPVETSESPQPTSSHPCATGSRCPALMREEFPGGGSGASARCSPTRPTPGTRSPIPAAT